MRIHPVIAAAAAAFCGISSCHRGAEPGEKPRPETPGVTASSSEHLDEALHPEFPRRVRLAPDVLANAKIAMVPVMREPLVATLSLPGEIASDPDRTAKISSPVAGRLEQVGFLEGSVIKKGDVLAQVRVPELGNIRSAYTAAMAKAKAARLNTKRQQALLAEKLSTEQAYEDAVAQAESFEAEAESLREQLSGLGATAVVGSGYLLALRSPIEGKVLTRDAVVGQPITPDKPIGSIADLRNVWFLGRVFEKDLAQLRLGAEAEVELNAYPGRQFGGAIQYIGDQVDATARTLTARIVLKNEEGLLRVGLFGAARVACGTPRGEPSLVVPRSSVIDVAGKSVVFVKQADGDFEMHEVVLGQGAPGKVEVVSGLREGEQVVSEGAFTLKSAVLRRALTEGE